MAKKVLQQFQYFSKVFYVTDLNKLETIPSWTPSLPEDINEADFISNNYIGETYPENDWVLKIEHYFRVVYKEEEFEPDGN